MKLIAIAAGAVLTILCSALPSAAMTDEECNAALKKADVNGDGTIAADEGARYYATLKVADKPVAEGSLTRDAFLENCKAGLFDERAVDAGAPLKGANSFTAAQAADRAVARGYSDVSGLALDADGIWRGTAKVDGKTVSLAVDYKGNVVAQ